MARGTAASRAGNSVVSAVEQVCGMFGVPVFRMQSRTFMVPGANGSTRPMFMGEWTDHLGVKRRKGMADLLTMPSIETKSFGTVGPVKITVPLWIECKSGSGRMTQDQKDFKEFVEKAGAYHICAHDSADEVIEWFKARGVRR